jgi:POT family proton-dependent oligopeptide transporter
MGINIGAALGPIACGFLGETYGWRYGFGAAGIGMALSLLIFVMSTSLLQGRGEPPAGARHRAAWIVYAGSVAGVLVSAWLVQRQEAVGQILVVGAALTFFHILFRARRRLSLAERRPIYLALLLIAIQPLFWGLYEQVGSSLNLFTDRYVDRTMFGIELPATLFVSLGAIYVVLLSPFFAWLWTALGRRGLEPSPVAKFGLALVQVGLGFLVLVAGAASGAQTPVIFIFLLYLLHVTGELCLSPVGVSAMTRLSVPEMAGLMMGAWFLATAAGNFMAGLIAQATSQGGVTTAETVISVYARMGWLAVAIGVVVCAAAPFAMRFARLEERT